jgi:predicted cytidylate kinase
MRQMAGERGMSVLEFGRLAEDDADIDREIDARTAELGRTRDGFVIDSRLAWHFIPGSIKVFLDVGIDVAAERIYGDDRGTETENVDVAVTRGNIEARTASESKRYQDYYGVDYLDHAHYDLVIDTSTLSVDEIVDRIAAFVRVRSQSPG